MNPVELHTPAGKPCGVWMCRQCRSLWGGRRDGERGQALAEACCLPKTCDECRQPITGEGHYTYRHRHCQGTCDARIREERIAKAAKLEAWDGPVWWGNCGPQDGYFRDMDELLDYFEVHETPAEDRPEWVFCSRAIPFPGADAGRICERITEDMFEGASEQLEGVAELEAACRAFNAANAGLISYEPDYKRVVRVPTVDGADAPTVAQGKEADPS